MLEIELIEIDRAKIKIEPAHILSLMGVPENAPDTLTMELIEKHISACLQLMTPKGGYSWVEAKTGGRTDGMEIEGIWFHTGKIIRNLFQKAEAYAFLVATAGPEIENKSALHMEHGEYLDGVIVDLIGSVVVESAFDQVKEHIRKIATGRGLKTTNRYGPGDCTWDVSEQKKLFRMLPDQCCGITLSETSLMIPRKSVSGVIAIGREVEFSADSCSFCARKDCAFRRVNYQGYKPL